MLWLQNTLLSRNYKVRIAEYNVPFIPYQLILMYVLLHSVFCDCIWNDIDYTPFIDRDEDKDINCCQGSLQHLSPRCILHVDRDILWTSICQIHLYSWVTLYISMCSLVMLNYQQIFADRGQYVAITSSSDISGNSKFQQNLCFFNIYYHVMLTFSILFIFLLLNVQHNVHKVLIRIKENSLLVKNQYQILIEKNLLI